MMNRSKAEIADLIPYGEFTKNPRMRQLYKVLTSEKVAESELRFFEAEVLAYRKKFYAAQDKRREFMKREAARYL